MSDFWVLASLVLPAWLLGLLGLVAATEMILLSLYLIKHEDHLILHSADLGLTAVFVLLTSCHLFLIQFDPNIERSIALSRIAWFTLFVADVVIMSRYLFAIVSERFRVPSEGNGNE